MPQDRAMRAFVIHLGVYVVGGRPSRRAQSLPQSQSYLVHLGACRLGHQASPPTTLRSCCSAPGGKKRSSPTRVRGFFIHLFVYVAVNALLIVVNLMLYADLLLVPLSAYRVGPAALGPCLRHLLSQARQRSIVQRSNRS